jgi:hypothetical protein
MPKSDFTHLRVTPAQSRELYAVLNAEVVASSWDAPMRKTQAEARAADGKPGARRAARGWDEAMQKASSIASPTKRK